MYVGFHRIHPFHYEIHIFGVWGGVAGSGGVVEIHVFVTVIARVEITAGGFDHY